MPRRPRGARNGLTNTTWPGLCSASAVHPDATAMIAADLALSHGRLNQITPVALALRLSFVATAALSLLMF